MADFFILALLGRPRTILGTKFKVAWDTERNVAVILRKEPAEKEYTQIDQTFTSELSAHGHLNMLESLNIKPENNWRDLTDD